MSDTAQSRNNTPRGKKTRTAAIIFGILVIATCTMIFMFSSQDATESSMTSGRFMELFKKLFLPDFDSMSPQEQAKLRDTMTHIIRKGAHFTEYLLLAQFSFHLLLALPRPRNELLCAGGALLFTAFFAMTDEYHQSFVPGRAMTVRDVLIDSLGALTGLLVALIIRRIIRRKREKSVSPAE